MKRSLSSNRAPRFALLASFGSTVIGATLALGAGCSSSDDTATPVPTAGSDGPTVTSNPNVHDVGNAAAGQDVFRFETFGNEGFWTDALKLPQGMVAAKFTPIMALKAGLQVDIEKLDDATKTALAAELKTDLSPTNAPKLNDPMTTVALVNANAVMGVAAKDSNGDGKIDVLAGDKVGISCAFCHSISDKSVFDMPNGGSIGKRVDGPAAHNLDVGGSIALASNSRAYFPVMQLQGMDGKTIGRVASFAGLTKDSTEAEVDAFLNDKKLYPVGMFDDTFDGNGNPMHNTPLFRTDLGAPWGTAGEFQKLDQFGNTVYTTLLSPTDLLTPGGRAFVHKAAGAAGDAMLADYEKVLADTGVTGFPYVTTNRTGTPGELDTLIGVGVDRQKLIDMSAYLNAQPIPAGVKGDSAAIARGRETFRSTAAGCTGCHNVDQGKFLPPMIIPMKTIFPGDAPVVLAPRDAPASPVENTPDSTFDDKQIVINASLRGLERGTAMPFLVDLARKPVFLHDNSVPTLEVLLDGSRGATAPHPFYLTDAKVRADVLTFLLSLDADSK